MRPDAARTAASGLTGPEERPESGVCCLRRSFGDLAQGGDHGALGPVLRVQLSELLLAGDGLLEAVVLQDGEPADDLLGLRVGAVDAGGLALANDEVDCV